MKPALKIFFAGFVASLVAGQALIPVADAHHSAAMYDPTHPITLSGTVKIFNWVNPHVTVEIVADTKDNLPAMTWVLEASSPGVMTRSGWTKRSFQPGDKVVVEVSPLRTGEPGGGFRKATLPDGTTLTWTFNAGVDGK